MRRLSLPLALATLALPACQTGETIGIKHLGLMSGSPAVQISAQPDGSCAVAASGKAYCWGENSLGDLGDGTREDSVEPVQVIHGDDFVAVEGTCGLLATGEVRCWADDPWPGGHDITRRFARKVTGAVSLLSGGLNSGCATDAGGLLTCWGFTFGGAEGLIEQVTLEELGGVIDVANGYPTGMYALTDDGRLYTVTDRWQGETLGRGVIERFDGIGDAVAIAGGWTHTCAVLAGGKVACWGANANGQLGNGDGCIGVDVTQSELPDLYTPPSCEGFDSTYGPQTVIGINDAVDVTVGYRFACALREGGRVSCWGDNEYGQLGDGTRRDRWTPVDVSAVDGAPVTQIAAGAHHVCALTRSGEVICWGSIGPNAR